MSGPLSLSFLGANGTVTGSKHLLDDGRAQVLVDCGLFQGYKQLRLRNWHDIPLPARAIDAVVLTHAHLDHSGYLPALARAGFRGAVYCTPATAALCEVLLPDAGHLQELDAAYANRHGFSRHSPALPLYTADDARLALDLLRPVGFGERFKLPGGWHAAFSRAGHILGAACLSVEAGGRTALFSGDLGRDHDVIMAPPEPRPAADVVVMEATYGDRLHDPEDPEEALGAVVRRTSARGGVVLIPAFSVGRTQALLVLLHHLRAAGRIPAIPVIVDSPMATSVTGLYTRHARDHRLDPATCREVFDGVEYTRDVAASKAIDRRGGPCVLISASGIQAGGTRGAALAAGARTLKIHGQHVPVRAEVARLDGLSAHADQRELIAWLGSGPRPRRLFLVHGEPGALDALRLAIHEQLGWDATVPDYRDTVDL